VDFYAPRSTGVCRGVALEERTEDGALQLYETATGRRLDDTIPKVNGGTAGGSEAWNGDASGIYYTRYPHGGRAAGGDLPFYQQIYYHKLGTPIAEDTYVLGKEFPKIAEVRREPESGRALSASPTLSNGDGGEHAHWLRTLPRRWTQITRFETGSLK